MLLMKRRRFQGQLESAKDHPGTYHDQHLGFDHVDDVEHALLGHDDDLGAHDALLDLL